MAKQSIIKWQFLGQLTFLTLVGMITTGCQNVGEPPAQARSQSEDTSVAVDISVARLGQLREDIEYTGNTLPLREVSLRSQIEGRLEYLKVDVGDEVQTGQVLARIDDNLLLGAVNQAQAQRAAQKSQVVSAQSEVNNALIRVEQARLELQQTQADITRLQASLNASIEQARLEAEQRASDAARVNILAREGAISDQEAEQARNRAKQAQQALVNQQVTADQQISQAQTTAQTAAKILRSAEAQVAIEQQQVAAAQAEVNAQNALISQAKTRQSYSTVTSPIQGKVIEKISETGNFVQPGLEILKLGDFSQVKVRVEVSELQLNRVKNGHNVPIKLDAFPEQTFRGTVSRISPIADSRTRLVPIEVTMNNPEGKIGGGLLARVSFPQDNAQVIIIPEKALQGDSTVFVIKDNQQVEARSVVVGNRENGQVEILSGLLQGERYVARSSRPLEDGSLVRPSILSEQNPS